MEKLDKLKWKVQHYEEFLHAINYAVTAGNAERIRQLVNNAFLWGYSHRMGNGEYTDEEEQANVDRATERLCNGVAAGPVPPTLEEARRELAAVKGELEETLRDNDALSESLANLGGDIDMPRVVRILDETRERLTAVEAESAKLKLELRGMEDEVERLSTVLNRRLNDHP
jgi:hypothetical protein